MRNKTAYLAAILSFLLLMPAQSQGKEGKFGSALSVGAKRSYNNIFVPYEFNGGDYGLLLEWRLPSSALWLSDAKLHLFTLFYTFRNHTPQSGPVPERVMDRFHLL